MNFAEALIKHAEWKLKLWTAIHNKQQLDYKKIKRDDCCDFGAWLNTEALTKYGELPSYKTCKLRHAAFHLEAAKVAKKINAGEYMQATTMMIVGTPFAETSASMGAALMALKNEANI